MKSYLFLKIKETAKKKKSLTICISGLEKYNLPSEKNEWEKKENTKHDGVPNESFDVEGHAWTDIYVSVSLNLFNFKDLLFFLKNATDSLKELIQTYKYFRFKSWIGYALNLFLTTFSFKRTLLAFTVASFDVLKSDLAEEKAAKQLEHLRPDSPVWEGNEIEGVERRLNSCSKTREWNQKLLSLTSHFYKKITYDQVLIDILKASNPIGHGLYVNKNDLFCIYIDTSVRPYDMKSGYSETEIAKIIQDWAKYFLKEKIFVVAEKELR